MILPLVLPGDSPALTTARLRFQLAVLSAALDAAARERHPGDHDYADEQVARWLERAQPAALRHVAEQCAAHAMEAAAAEEIRSGRVH